MKLNTVYLLCEDTPTNYINQLVNQVLKKETTKQNNRNKISFINFNSKRKEVDKLRVDSNGNKLSQRDFINQGINYFDSHYKALSRLRQIVLDALEDYTT